MVITRADGSYVWDGDGKRYLDFSSQLVNTNIGHQHPRVVAASRSRRRAFAPSLHSMPTINARSMNFNRLHIVPPCTISETEADEGLEILDHALATADKFTRS